MSNTDNKACNPTWNQRVENEARKKLFGPDDSQADSYNDLLVHFFKSGAEWAKVFIEEANTKTPVSYPRWVRASMEVFTRERMQKIICRMSETKYVICLDEFTTCDDGLRNPLGYTIPYSDIEILDESPDHSEAVEFANWCDDNFYYEHLLSRFVSSKYKEQPETYGELYQLFKNR